MQPIAVTLLPRTSGSTATLGGQVFGDVTDLNADVIGSVAGDVPGTVDGRDVFGDIASEVLAATDLSTIFPGHDHQRVGVTA